MEAKTENFFKTEVSKKFWDEAVQVAHTRHGVNRSDLVLFVSDVE